MSFLINTIAPAASILPQRSPSIYPSKHHIPKQDINSNIPSRQQPIKAAQNVSSAVLFTFAQAQQQRPQTRPQDEETQRGNHARRARFHRGAAGPILRQARRYLFSDDIIIDSLRNFNTHHLFDLHRNFQSLHLLVFFFFFAISYPFACFVVFKGRCIWTIGFPERGIGPEPECANQAPECAGKGDGEDDDAVNQSLWIRMYTNFCYFESITGSVIDSALLLMRNDRIFKPPLVGANLENVSILKTLRLARVVRTSCI